MASARWRTRFNGAAVFQPRKLPCPADQSVDPGGASMGPRSFNRGNVALPSILPSFRPGFNGAAVFQPRKFPRMMLSAPVVKSLQWGRGLSTAEMTSQRRPSGIEFERFNGAAVFQPRKSAALTPPPRVAEPLQWGRGLSTAEIASGPACRARTWSLQWGRGLSTAEIPGRY